MPRIRRTLLALAAALVATSALADDITTTGGKKITGKLVAIDATGATFSTGDARVTVPGKEIVVIDLGNKVAPIPKDKTDPTKLERMNEIELTDGSTIRAGKYAVKARKLEAELLTVPDTVPAPSFELPLSGVFSVMRGAEDEKNRDAWKKMLGGRGKRDLYVMREREGLNFIQGTVLSGSEDGKTFDFELEGGKKADPQLLQSRATGGLVFSHPTPAQVPQTLCKVLDVYGNSLVAQAVQVTPEGVTVTTISGVVFKYPSAAALAKFDYAKGNVAYLSDLQPQVDAPPVGPDEKGLRTNPVAPYFRDQGVSGEPLKLGTDTFVKGLTVSPDVFLTFNIGGDYREFKAVLGVPENSPDANLEAKVTIELDGKPAFSESLKRKDKPKPLVLDVKGVKLIRVLVEADLPVNGNRVIFADARVEK